MQLGEMFATKYEDNIYQADKVIMDNITQMVCSSWPALLAG